jgi:hypothetical protein
MIKSHSKSKCGKKNFLLVPIICVSQNDGDIDGVAYVSGADPQPLFILSESKNQNTHKINARHANNKIFTCFFISKQIFPTAQHDFMDFMAALSENNLPDWR